VTAQLGTVPLLRRPPFRYLLGANAVSQFGTQVSLVAFPLVAILTLGASALQIGLLAVAQTSAYLVIGLPAGAWVDRLPKRSIMVVADALRAVLLLSIPAAGMLHILTMGQLYAVAAIAGLATVMFDVAYQSSLLTVVGRADLVEANVRMESARIVAQLAGPSVAGWLLEILLAPLVILVDGISFLLSAVLLHAGGRYQPDRRPDRTAQPPRTLLTDVREGLRFVRAHPVLRLLAIITLLTNFFAGVLLAVQVPFLVSHVHLTPFQVGLVGSVGAIGGAIGVMIARRLTRRFGALTMAWAAPLCTWPLILLMPLAQPGRWAVLYPLGWLVVSAGIVLYNVNQVSFRQGVTPEGLLGRMNATLRFLGQGSLPLGALTGGLIGHYLSLRAGIWTSALGELGALVPLLMIRTRATSG
jgi:fucose permease